MLDIDLARSSTDVKHRFEQSLKGFSASDAVPVSSATGPNSSREDTAAVPPNLGERSKERTTAILSALESQQPDDLEYFPPADARRLVSDFLASPARVFLVTGPPGCGKTSFTWHLASRDPGVDVQLLTADSWTDDVDLAREILRYASAPAGADPLLTLENESKGLSRPLLVVIDSPQVRAVVDRVCRQLDGALRQVLSQKLRFVLVFRTPPNVELAPYPVLSAAIMTQGHSVGSSLHLDRWDIGTARDIWNGGRHESDPPFDAMPSRIRNLARLPLYMSLIRAAKTTGSFGHINAYRLVEFCVASILRSAGLDAERAMAELTTLALSQLAPALPDHLLTAAPADRPALGADFHTASVAMLVRPGSSGSPTFHHDVIREYLFARWLAQLVEARGRSSATIELLNDLAARTSVSADLRGVFEFLLQCLDATIPELLATVAQSPSISITETLPLILDLTGENAAFATDEVLRVCASRCLHDNGLPLTKALLRNGAAGAALDTEYPGWMLRVLRRFGPAIWSDIVACVETHLPVATVQDFVRLAQLDSVEDAVFLARHFFVFFAGDDSGARELKALLSHPDWRARAALADGIQDGRAIRQRIMSTIIESLIGDRDYKVRAAIANAVGRLVAPAAEQHLATLLNDRNWYVRERLLQGLSVRAGDVGEAADLVLADSETWASSSPATARVAVQRLLLQSGRRPVSDDDSYRRALFGLLREMRTGALRLPANIESGLVREGLASPDWLVQSEAQAVNRADAEKGSGVGISKEAFRRLRDGRALQVALDVRDIEYAVMVAEAAVTAGVAFIEIGDPLIKSVGMKAISEVKQRIPNARIVAEMMSADWGRDQVVLAAEAGADVVLLIGPASIASVSAAVEAGRRFAVPIMIDVPDGRLTQSWVQDMERTGIDGFAITTNIDLGVAGFHPLDQAKLIRSWTKLPVAVSGGFEPADVEARRRRSWDILIVGRGITDSLNPAVAARDLAASIELTGESRS